MSDDRIDPLELDLRPEVPHSARIWNFWLGGKDHYLADEELGRRVTEGYPQAQTLARASRAFQDRAVRYLTRERGLRQFLDLGTGLPTVMPTHRSAQEEAPAARVVYVDNDPIVLTHARALLTSSPEGATAYVDADLRDEDSVLAAAADTLDLAQPVGLLCLSTLGHTRAAEGAELMQRYMARLVPGSHLVICDTIRTPETLRAEELYASGDTPPYWCREPREIEACAHGLELMPPGLAPINRLVVDGRPAGPDVDQWGLVAVKPA
ncbi:SAM-dependent methyltransferase [Streptomyces buecherae]|uniref:SAM-dependent methyltransferase n=1 Tax=Streptomyces buecherae TaxID=2763006 RepID=UPI00378C6401